ncbi:MAG: hypothetical protein ACK4K7_01800 [Allosphingosinicella sp.]|uniref:hypothetical protein n=1 Tax=Allosphingosinicella sp. TaxID=2823234 RepID=UPI00393535E3
MRKSGGIAAAAGASLVALALVLAPADATTSAAKAKARPGLSLSAGSFTPAVADARLAAELQRRGVQSGSFRFTPSAAAAERSQPVRVAVRARADTPLVEATRTAEATPSATPVTAITPTSYNLGVAVGWRRFSVTGDVSETEGGVLPGRRESARLGIGYAATRRISGRVAVQAEHVEGAQRIVADDTAYSLDVAGSYSITRNIDVTGGVRYRIARDRLEPIADERRDSQAVYIGTAFRF